MNIYKSKANTMWYPVTGGRPFAAFTSSLNQIKVITSLGCGESDDMQNMSKIINHFSVTMHFAFKIHLILYLECSLII